jgi:hypothetical protein
MLFVADAPWWHRRRLAGDAGEIVLGPPLMFTKENIDRYDF